MDEHATSAALTDSDKALIAQTAASDLFVAHPVPDAMKAEFEPSLHAFVNIPPTCRSNLFGIYPKGADVNAFVQADWEEALRVGALRLFDENTVSFPLRIAGPNYRSIDVSIRRSTHLDAEKPWYMTYVPIVPFTRSSAEALRGRFTEEDDPRTFDPPPEPCPDALLGMRRTDEYLANPLPVDIAHDLKNQPGALSAFCHLPAKWRMKIREIAKADIDAAAFLDREWETCLASGAMRHHNGNVIFPVGLMRSDGTTPVEVTIKRDARYSAHGAGDESLPWVAIWVDDYVKRAVVAGKALERWAFMGSWDDVLQELADFALAERWDFSEEEGTDGRRYSILRSYLIYTFYRLETEGKVLEDEAAGIAAFNTGLVTKTYDPIFACFSPAEGPRKWRFETFCKEGSRGWGKKLSSTFNPPPARAEYIACKDDLLYDSSRTIVLDKDHILLDNIMRLPIDFLEEETRGNEECKDAIEQIKQTSDERELGRVYAELRDLIEDDTKVMRRLINRLQDAVDVAEKRVEWNYRTAVPAFYPSRNTMSLLLPLDLTEDEKPDIALVVELTDSGVYLGQTILTMRMAYNNARLICRPDSDWLNTSIRLVDESEDES